MKSPIQKMSTYHQGGNTSFSNFPIQDPLRIMSHLVGGKLAKEVTFFLFFEQAHFVMFSCLLVVLFVKLLYYTAYFFKNSIHFHFFFGYA